MRTPFATLQALNLQVGGAAVTRFCSQWYPWAVRSRLDPVKKVAGMLKRHVDGVLRFVKHPITNGVAEGRNSKIMSLKRKAGGFRNPQNFTAAIHFHCGDSTSTHADPERGFSSKRFPAVTDELLGRNHRHGRRTYNPASSVRTAPRDACAAEVGQISLRPTGSQSVSNGVIGRRSPVRVPVFAGDVGASATPRIGVQKGPRSADNEARLWFWPVFLLLEAGTSRAP